MWIHMPKSAENRRPTKRSGPSRGRRDCFGDEAHARESGEHDAAGPSRTVGAPSAISADRDDSRQPPATTSASRAVAQARIGVHACCRDNWCGFPSRKGV
jgi:hypothetical protein